MERGLYIFRDDEFDAPIYAKPSEDDVDERVWTLVCTLVVEAFEGEGKYSGSRVDEEWRVTWRFLPRMGISFVAVVPKVVSRADLDRYLAEVQRAYLDEVDEARFPELEGVADLMLDVEPPWDIDD